MSFITPRRSSVLGKRSHQRSASSCSLATCDQLATPDSTPDPKRPRTSLTLLDGTNNKENIPPYRVDAINAETPDITASRRPSTESIHTPARPGARKSVTQSNAATGNESPITPATAQASLATPPATPQTNLPLHAAARALLRATVNSEAVQVVGRDDERKLIATFIERFLAGESSGQSLYVSGSPGTGKTALVNDILSKHQESQENVQVLSLNCMAFNDVDALWDKMIEVFGDAQTSKSAAKGKKARGREAIVKLLAKTASKCVFVLDELDHIASDATSLAAVFSLPQNLDNACIIGIANTHTLTSDSTSTPDNVQTVHFQPYTSAQLLSILQARLSPLHESDDTKAAAAKFLPTPTLMMLSKKVATMTGDVRCLLEVSRAAIDLAVASQKPSTPCSVTPGHAIAALKTYSSSSAAAASTSASSANTEVVRKIVELGIQARLVLLAVVLAAKRQEAGLPLGSPLPSPAKTPAKRPTGKRAASPIKASASLSSVASVGKMDTGRLYVYYDTILSRSETGLFQPVSRSEFGDLMGMLDTTGLVSMTTSSVSSTTGKTKRGFSRSSSFTGGMRASSGASSGEVMLAPGVWVDEIVRGLGINDQVMVDAKAEEVCAIWQRELARNVREARAAAQAADGADKFDEAMED
ncbi:P-loop containing nucleoside triphosphate hydrolase protein [Schizophyllum commune]